MCRCQFCGDLIDSDLDPECIYDTDDQLDVIACETCRTYSDMERELDYRAHESDMERKSA
jgi:hypothetical protein